MAPSKSLRFASGWATPMILLSTPGTTPIPVSPMVPTAWSIRAGMPAPNTLPSSS